MNLCGRRGWGERRRGGRVLRASFKVITHHSSSSDPSSDPSSGSIKPTEISRPAAAC
jgi:hypothetical protein